MITCFLYCAVDKIRRHSGASVKNEKSADKKSVCGDDSDDSFDTVCDMNYEDDIEG